MVLGCVSAIVSGRVQGVYFRAFVQREAQPLGLTGYVRNRPDGRSLEVVAEGDQRKLAQLVELLRTGPDGSAVEKVELEWGEYRGGFDAFNIRY